MRILLALLALTVPFAASAMDLDFYTYNGFEETVDAFKRLALIFSDIKYQLLVFIFAVGGIVFIAFSSGTKALGGEQINPIGIFIPVLAGLVIYVGMVKPTGSVHVYDPVRNAYEEVPGVPDLIVLIGGGLNKVERAIATIVDTASANPYGEEAGAINYSLLTSAQKINMPNWYLEKSISNYYVDCGMPYLGQSTTNERQSLFYETSDMLTEYAKWAHANLSVVYYPQGNDGGVVKTCKAAWEDAGGLKEILESPATFTDTTEGICSATGYNTADAAQLAQCKTQLQSTTELFGVVPGSEVPLLRNMVMTRAMADAYNQADFTAAQSMSVNRQVMAEGFGSAQALAQWVPKVRSFMLASMLGIVPIIFLFIATPIFKSAITVTLGIFAWLTLWGGTDISASQMAADAARAAFTQITAQGLSYMSILHSPEAAVEALGVFSKSRLQAMGMATFLAAALFKVSGGYAFARIGEQWQNHLDQIGEKAGVDTMLEEQKSAAMRGLYNAPGGMAQMAGEGGFNQAAFAAGMDGQRQMGAYERYVGEDLVGSAGYWLQTEGALNASGNIGNVEGIQQGADYHNLSPEEGARVRARTDAADSVSSAATRQKHDFEHMGGTAAGAETRALDGMERGYTRHQLAAELADNAGSPRLSDGYEQLSGVEQAPLVGTAHEQSPEEATRVHELNAITAKAAAETYDQNGGDDAALTSGKGRAQFDIAQSRATTGAVENYGQGALDDAEEYSRGQQIGAGQVGNVNETPLDTGRFVGESQAARGLAAADNQRNFAAALGYDPSNTNDVISFERARDGSFGAVIDGPNKDAAIDKLEANGVFNEEQADIARASDGPLNFTNLTLDPNNPTLGFTQGQVTLPGSSQVQEFKLTTHDEGSRFTALDSTRIGTDNDFTDNESLGSSIRVDGSATLADADSRQKYLRDTVRDGELSNAEVRKMAMAYSERLSSEGSSLNVSSIDAQSNSLNGGISTGILEEFGIKAGAGHERRYSDQETANSDVVIATMGNNIADNYSAAHGIVADRLGDYDGMSDLQKATFNDEVIKEWDQLNEADYTNLVEKVADENAGNVAKSNDYRTTEQQAEDIKESLPQTWR